MGARLGLTQICVSRRNQNRSRVSYITSMHYELDFDFGMTLLSPTSRIRIVLDKCVLLDLTQIPVVVQKGKLKSIAL